MKFPDYFPVTCHTDYVGPGSTFVAIRGYHQDGAQYISEAIQKGARTIVIDQGFKLTDDPRVQLVRVSNTRKALAQLSAQAADYPAKKLKCIGITGTKGKTITSWLLAHILKQAGYKTALLSTAGNCIGDHRLSASLTTPQPDYLHQFLKFCVQEKIEYVVMEVAAQALSLHRIDGVLFDAIVFTNFGLEHLEFYDSMDAYFDAKCALLEKRKPDAPAWLNADDVRLKTIKSNNVHWFSLHKPTEMGAVFLEHLGSHKLSGTYNQYNILAAAGAARSFAIHDDVIQQAIKSFTGVPGRMERYQLPNGAIGIIDYAHNPMSYEALLSYLRTQTNHLIVVFGAGGQRDASRRPLMGNVVNKYADLIVLTSDNPRTEDPKKIVEDIKKGITSNTSVITELDRELAIQKAYINSNSNSIIAMLGKGPDEYQIIGPRKTYFSEKAILESLT